MTCKTGQMSVHPCIRLCGVNIFKVLRLESAGPTSVKLSTYIGHRTKLIGSLILNFGLFAMQGHPKLSLMGEMTHPDHSTGVHILQCIIVVFTLHIMPTVVWCLHSGGIGP